MTEPGRAYEKAVNIGLAFVISAWIHILGLGLLRYFPPLPDLPTTVPVTLEIESPVPPAPGPHETRPEVQAAPASAERSADSQAPAQPVADSGRQAPNVLEDTISLESKAPQYVSYLGQVKARIKQYWIFPPAARQKQEAGQLTAFFTLDRGGSLLQVLVEKSSGRPHLDQAALEAVRRAAPYPEFPRHINLDRLNIRAHFDYRIRYIGVR
ncbi:MAG: TonB family protein [Proteobacteria bacterium]|nr:TonB family protein [Pseudomonadota bacterium]